MSSPELHLKYRPQSIDELVGQPGAVAVMRKWGAAPPHAIMMTGPPGTGKTTAAYALLRALGATVENHNVQFVNCATLTGVDHVRTVVAKLNFRGIGKRVGGKDPVRGWMWEEVHLLSNQAQAAMLTELENMPPHAYFVFSTTHPHKLLPALRGRCTQIEMKPVGAKDLCGLLDRVAKLEKPKVPLSANVRDDIAQRANGCVREVLVNLGKVLPLASEDDRLAALSSVQAEKQAIDLCRLLMKKPTWAECAKLLKEVVEEPETVRRAVLGYATAILLNGRKDAMALAIIDVFRDNFFDSGKAGLVAACCEICK